MLGCSKNGGSLGTCAELIIPWFRLYCPNVVSLSFPIPRLLSAFRRLPIHSFCASDIKRLKPAILALRDR